MTTPANTTADGALACAYGEPWLGDHPFCRARLDRDGAERGEMRMGDFQQYRRSQIGELRPYAIGESMDGVSIADVDRANGSPRAGDMIARNPKNHQDQWLVAAEYFAANFEPVS